MLACRVLASDNLRIKDAVVDSPVVRYAIYGRNHVDALAVAFDRSCIALSYDYWMPLCRLEVEMAYYV